MGHKKYSDTNNTMTQIRAHIIGDKNQNGNSRKNAKEVKRTACISARMYNKNNNHNHSANAGVAQDLKFL